MRSDYTLHSSLPIDNIVIYINTFEDFMTDIVDLKCEDCDSEINIQLPDVYDGNIITCPSCKTQIQLKVEGGHGQSLQDALDDIDEVFKRFDP